MYIITACVQIWSSCIVWKVLIVKDEEKNTSSDSDDKDPISAELLTITRIMACIGMIILVSKGFGDILKFYTIFHNQYWKNGVYFIFGVIVNYCTACILTIASINLTLYEHTVVNIFSQSLLVFFILEIDDWAYIFISNMSFDVFNNEFFWYKLRKSDIKDKYLLNGCIKTTYLFGAFMIVVVFTAWEVLDYESISVSWAIGVVWCLIGLMFGIRYIQMVKK